ncbi:MAG: hypothetical protein V4664_01405 [Patescibacteria group bacterium]
MITINEAKRWLPSLIVERFAEAHNAIVEAEEGESEIVKDMLSLRGWQFVGYAIAEKVLPGGKTPSYLCMFELGDVQAWCHLSESKFLLLAGNYHLQGMSVSNITAKAKC